MRDLKIQTARVFVPLLAPARDKGAFGGRGSAKSHNFAEMLVGDGLRFPGEAGEGMRAVCAREIQKSLKESAKFLIESKLEKFRLGEADGYKVFSDTIQTPKDGIIMFQGLQDHTAESIKSFEGFHRFWGEEAQTISGRSISLIRPTIRWEDVGRGLQSELWWSWNPRRKTDAIDALLRGENKPTGAVVVQSNWSDNPWFPQVLEQERQDCIRINPGQYNHIWEGGYATVLEGAYFAEQLARVRLNNQISRVGQDPLMIVRIFCDIGGTGAKADSFTMWAAQFIGRENRVIDCYESQGQPIGAHLNWLRLKGFTPGNTIITLPHDGDTNDKVIDVSYHSAFKSAQYKVEVLKNQGKGAAMFRIESVRRTLSSCWFNEDTTKGGLEALGWYHEKKDEKRDVGLGPDHDWSSHISDAFGLMSLCFEKYLKDSQHNTPNMTGSEFKPLTGSMGY